MRSNTTYNVCKWHSDEWHNAISGPAYRTKVKLQMAADDNNNREKNIAKTILSMSQLWANKFIVSRDYSIASLMSRNNKIEIEIHRTARWWLAFVSSECLRNAFFFLVFRVFCCYTRLISKSRGLRLIVDLRSFCFSFFQSVKNAKIILAPSSFRLYGVRLFSPYSAQYTLHYCL